MPASPAEACLDLRIINPQMKPIDYNQQSADTPIDKWGRETT